MSLWIDKKYINLISNKLDRFAWKKPSLAVFRCPFCGDSKKSKTKTRGHVFEAGQSMLFKCHNCNHSTNTGGLLKQVDMGVYNQYAFDMFGSRNDSKKANNTPTTTLPVVQPKRVYIPREFAEPILHLPIEHYARVYLTNRQLPTKALERLYFCPNFKAMVDAMIPDNEIELFEEARIIIPFISADHRLIAIQGRSLDTKNNKLRYITIKAPGNFPKIFGLDKFDSKKPGYAVEGPIDSLFLPNAIAVAGSNIHDVVKYVGNNITQISDNEPRNKAIVRGLHDALKNGIRIFIWPQSMKGIKDINDAILAGYSITKLVDIIEKNTFSGLEANLALSQWSKI